LRCTAGLASWTCWVALPGAVLTFPCGGGVKFPFDSRIGWKELGKKLYRKYEDHAVSDLSAALAYYFIFSLFPFLFFVVSLTAYLPLGNSISLLMDRLRPVLPAQAMALIDQHLHALVSETRPKLLTV